MEIKLIEREFWQIVEIEGNIKTFSMSTFFKNSYTKLQTYISWNSMQPKWPPIARYEDVDWEELDKQSAWTMFIELFTKKWHIFAWIPISEKLESNWDINSKEIKKNQYITALHKWAYKNVWKTYSKIIARAKENDIKIKNTSIEEYLNDPATVKQKDLETQLFVPTI